jgi:hypothetical protein
MEEPSMEEALQILLPRMLRPDIEVKYIQFGDKGNLLRELPKRLRGYREWLPPTATILVVVDRDDDDCHALKRTLEGFAMQTGFATKSAPHQSGSFQVINRIAIEELESWYFGDWNAVRRAYPRMPDLSAKATYRHADEIVGGTWEALERELQKRGYFASGLRKREFAREVAAHMEPVRNSSPSFVCLRNALAAL